MIRVNNGRSASLSFGDPPIASKARIVEHGGKIEAAYYGDLAQLQNETTVTVDGEVFAIIERAKGDVKGTVRLVLGQAVGQP